MSEDFKAFGQVLRFPVFLAGVALWTIYIFPFVLGFTLFVTIAHPICVPVLYALAYIAAAFSARASHQIGMFIGKTTRRLTFFGFASVIEVCIIGFVMDLVPNARVWSRRQCC